MNKFQTCAVLQNDDFCQHVGPLLVSLKVLTTLGSSTTRLDQMASLKRKRTRRQARHGGVVEGLSCTSDEAVKEMKNAKTRNLTSQLVGLETSTSEAQILLPGGDQMMGARKVARRSRRIADASISSTALSQLETDSAETNNGVMSKLRRRRRPRSKKNDTVKQESESSSTVDEPFSDVVTPPKPRRRTSRQPPPKSEEGHETVEREDELESLPKQTRKSRRVTKKKSPYFKDEEAGTKSTRKGPTRKRKKREKVSADVDETVEAVSAEISDRQPISEDKFGLLQEVYAPDALRVIIVAMFCNQTPGTRARPFLVKLFEKYPNAEALSRADQEELAQEIRPLGLFNVRARRLIQLATQWLSQPPQTGQVSPRKGLAKKIGYPDTEISHLPGCGPYAMDSYRLFCTGEGWRSVRPDDKELRPYVQWRWSREGVNYQQLLKDDPTVR